MRVAVNGEDHDVPTGTTVEQIIRILNLTSAACAAEVNKALVSKRNHSSHELHEGDRVELVSLVGGG